MTALAPFRSRSSALTSDRRRRAAVMSADTSGVTSRVRSSPSSAVMAWRRFCASPIEAFTRTSAFWPFSSRISPWTSRIFALASAMSASTSGEASRVFSSDSRTLRSVSRFFASSICTSTDGATFCLSRAVRSLERVSTCLPALSTSLPRSRMPFWAPVTRASKMARTVRSAMARRPLLCGLLAGGVEGHGIEHAVVVGLARRLRLLQGTGAEAPPQGHDVGVLVVRVLALRRGTTTRGAPAGSTFGVDVCRGESVRPLVVVEVVPLVNREAEPQRRLGLGLG
jgi:hypothetical protein